MVLINIIILAETMYLFSNSPAGCGIQDQSAGCSVPTEGSGKGVSVGTFPLCLHMAGKEMILSFSLPHLFGSVETKRERG